MIIELITAASGSASDIAVGTGAGAFLALAIREAVPALVNRFGKNGGKKTATSGDLPPAHWEGKFDRLGEAMHLLAENQKTGNDILQGIRTDLKIVMDRIPR